MPRASFNVLVYPYHKLLNGDLLYAVLKRSDEGWWQGVAGGGEDNETPAEAARREAREEGGLSEEDSLLELTTVISIPVVHFEENCIWDNNLYVIPQYCFGASVRKTNLEISSEHKEYQWLRYEEAQVLLCHDGDRTALWELHSRLSGRGPRGLGLTGL